MKATAIKTFRNFEAKQLVTPGMEVEGNKEYIEQLVGNGLAVIETPKKEAPKNKAKSAAPENKAK